MLQAMGERFPSTSAGFKAQGTAAVFRGKFEQERTGTKAAGAAATKEIRTDIEKNYQAQLTTNSSIKSYAIEITESNHALLHWDLPNLASPRDLGALPQTLAST